MTMSAPAAPQAKGADLIKDTTTQAFAKDVLEESRRQPVLVDFWAPWCGPCRTLSPIIEKAVKAANGAVRLVKMNIDDHPAIAGQLGIQSIPAVIAFHNGQPVDGFVGALPESQVKAFIDRVAGPAGPSDVELLVEEGNRLLAAKDAAGAAEHFAAALAADPASVQAIAGLASAHLATGDFEGARKTIETVPAAAANDPAIAAVRARVDVASETAKLTASLGDPSKLADRIAANPADFDARFDLAMIENGRGNRQAAADQLLEIVRKNRSWADEKARKQLVQFFEAWGPMDEATLSARRRLSSMLFS
ncbi:MAG TPA: thioredoxin [Bauldia sp.]|nr:thioredoxin [Bauldia sp.]